MIAGFDYELAIFREVCDYPHLAEEQASGNFDYVSDHEMYQRAQPAVRRILRQPRDEAVRTYRERIASASTLDELQTVLAAAHHGRIDTLLIDAQAECLGHFDPNREVLDLHPMNRADDLLNAAAVETLLRGGKVYALRRDEMPCPGLLAAILRY